MKKLILSAAVAAALCANVAVASDDDHRGSNTTATQRVENTNRNTNTNRNSNRNTNQNSNRNTNTNRNSNRQNQSQTANGGSASSTATASNNSSGNNTTFNESYRDRLQAAQAYAPGLTSGIDTCLGSASVGAQTQLFGVSGGKTVVDENCVLIKNTKLLLEMGLPTAACFYARQEPKIDQAMAAAGVECREPPPVPAVPVEDVPIPSDPANKSAKLISSQYK